MVKKKRQNDAHDNGTWTDSCDDDVQSPNAPSSNCQHVKKSVDTTRLRKLLKTTGLSLDCTNCIKLSGDPSGGADVSGFEYDNTLWLCLKCGTQLCGRSKNQHALLHFKTPHSDCHALTMNTRSFEIWCYDCDNEVSANTRKNLLECVELVKKLAQKPPAGADVMTTSTATMDGSAAPDVVAGSVISNVLGYAELVSKLASSAVADVGKTVAATMNDSAAADVVAGAGDASNVGNETKIDIKTNNKLANASSTVGISAIPLPPPLASGSGSAKFVNDLKTVTAPTVAPSTRGVANNIYSNCLNTLDRLPRVRGLTNLGNTCFFNAVMQCLAQTPFLLEVLKELAEPGEEFILPGGTFKFKDKDDVELPMIKGTLSSWGGLTAALAHALEELQSGGAVFTPSRLFDKLCNKCPQFTGGDQHDSHELLRQLLESVRSEDLKRYQRVILQNLGYKDQDINSVSEDMRQKCKIYGNQAADRILRPEQVFRGFLVSTLTCQDCFNVSSRHEYFLDMSLPVTVEKPQPPQRRKASPELESLPNGINTNFTGNETNVTFSSPSFFLHPTPGPSKSHIKKEKEKERKAKRAAKHQRNKQAQRLTLKINGSEVPAPENADVVGTDTNATGDIVPTIAGGAPREDTYSSSISTSEHSDADIEDNLIEDSSTEAKHAKSQFYTDTNGNNQQINEKRDDTPENMDKDSLEEDENDSGIATSPLHAGGTSGGNNNNDKATGGMTSSNSVLSFGLSERGASLVRQLSLGEGISTVVASDQQQHMTAVNQPRKPIVNTTKLTNGGTSEMSQQLDQLQLQSNQLLTEKQRKRQKRVRTQSYSDWSTTIAPRYQCDDGECSVQSCLNNFTAVELMTGNNKVGCESCTKRINGDDPKAKTVNTNATKQFLISSPPAVLILHLKRFQLGPRCIFRKLTRAVSFPLLLDIAPFCGSKVKNLPNIDRKQKKLLYALYGIVEHAGSMYGGHYTAYVKVRPKLMPDDKRWKFLPHGSKAELDQDDEQLKKLEELLAKEKAREMRLKAVDDSDDLSSSMSSASDESQTHLGGDDNDDVDDGGGEYNDTSSNTTSNTTTNTDDEASNVHVPIGKWYYVSDSRVQEVNEETVLKAQAYLLFYERIY